MAGIYNGHLLEFPLIRVDCFTSPPPPPHSWYLPDPQDPTAPPRPAPNAQLFLLTHVHTDHLTGLTGNFTGHIICSPDTKRMLLELEAEVDREHTHHGNREVRKRKYEGLDAKTRVVGGQEQVVDRISKETLNSGETKTYHIGYERGEKVHVSITLLDANHCPGSSMFLVTSPSAAILHTGDVRADPTFQLGLVRIPRLQEFIAPRFSARDGDSPPMRQLDRIYLDTSALLRSDLPEKEPVMDDLVRYMRLYPSDTVFFLNVWCFGWEYVVEAVARCFGELVHVDRYKQRIYSAIRSNPFLSRCTTNDSSATRFHACETKFRCSSCDAKTRRMSGDKRLLVHVNMAEVKAARWDELATSLHKAAAGNGLWPAVIEVPLARHSLLPELEALVKVFRPKSLSPNTLDPNQKGLDLFHLSDTFKAVISEEAQRKMKLERDWWFAKSNSFGREWLAQQKASLRTATKAATPETQIDWQPTAQDPPPPIVFDPTDNPGLFPGCYQPYVVALRATDPHDNAVTRGMEKGDGANWSTLHMRSEPFLLNRRYQEPKQSHCYNPLHLAGRNGYLNPGTADKISGMASGIYRETRLRKRTRTFAVNKGHLQALALSLEGS